MKLLVSCGAAVALLASVAFANEKALKSGLQVGDSVGFFEVVKCGGADDDGVSVGDKLCYR
jgi:hypothetical protein